MGAAGLGRINSPLPRKRQKDLPYRQAVATKRAYDTTDDHHREEHIDA
jgi:hypothetical protein